MIPFKSRRENFYRSPRSQSSREFPQDADTWGRAAFRSYSQCLAWVLASISLFLLYSFTSRYSIEFPASEYAASSCSLFPNDCEEIAPYIFDSVFSLLKQSHNTFAPNGHSIVRASIAPNTLLYHATNSQDIPTGMTFYALDAEMSIGIFGSVNTPRLYTMSTSRQLNLVYFDGQSASLTDTGSLDSQIAVLKGNVPINVGDEYVYNETNRAYELCHLANDLGVDGVVRMNAGFEVLVCDYNSAGVEVLFSSNLTVPESDPGVSSTNLPRDPNRQPPFGVGNIFAEQNGWEWIRSGVWHYGRETRVKLDFCAIASFYDPQLRSIIGAHHGGVRGNQTYQNGWGLRRGHRLIDIGSADVARMKSWIRTLTTLGTASKDQAVCSGTDWQALTETITDQHRSRALEIWNVLITAHTRSIEQSVQRVHELSHAILYPYLEYPSIIGVEAIEIKEQTVSRCATLYTKRLARSNLNDFETLIKDSIEIVLNGICEWEWSIFEWSENRTSNYLFASADTISAKPIALSEELKHHEENTRAILAWMGWDVQYSCEEKCSWDELCYIPMWPIIYAPGRRQGAFYAGSKYKETDMEEFWQPKCLGREAFDKGGGRARDPWHQLPDVRRNETSESVSEMRVQSSDR